MTRNKEETAMENDHTNEKPLLSVKHIDITFGSGRKKFKAIDDVSFDIYKGETFSLVGESGSGKTTIGRAIVRINPLSAGAIYYDGQKISGKIPADELAKKAAEYQKTIPSKTPSLKKLLLVENYKRKLQKQPFPQGITRTRPQNPNDLPRSRRFS
jgi:ABC-type oligopeptide transport system ATPase subunit